MIQHLILAESNMARSATTLGGGAAPQPFNYEQAISNPPLTLCVDLSNEKAVNEFISDQQEHQIQELHYQVQFLQAERERSNNDIVRL